MVARTRTAPFSRTRRTRRTEALRALQRDRPNARTRSPR